MLSKPVEINTIRRADFEDSVRITTNIDALVLRMWGFMCLAALFRQTDM